MTRAAWIRSVAAVAFGLCLVVVVFGAYVRLSDAGLGCPDWPGCYGHLTPLGAAADAPGTTGYTIPLHTGKAWREMIHRYAATTLGVLIIVIAALAYAWRRDRRHATMRSLSASSCCRACNVPGHWLLKPL
jgi:cytochrome c oxidase assembly protein subunit 15